MEKITVEAKVKASPKEVWDCWTGLDHINGWAFASEDWGAEAVENDLQVGGNFKTNMFAKDGSAGFDFSGVYTNISPYQLIEYKLDDGRQVKVIFEEIPEGVHITQTFDPEDENSIEMQRDGWQAFLDNFKKYVEDYASV